MCFKKQKHTNEGLSNMEIFYSFTFLSPCLYGVDADTLGEAGRTLDRSPASCGADIHINHTHVPFREAVSLIHMSLDCGRKPEHSEETHEGMETKQRTKRNPHRKTPV